MRFWRNVFSSPLLVTGCFAVFSLLLHFLFNGRYGYNIDEYYYIACSEHPALGYVDHPPLSIAILAFWRTLFNDSLFALRFLPAVAGSLTILLTGMLVREFGGGRFAQAVACLGVLISPLFLFMFNVYSMNAFDVLIWTASVYLFVRIMKSDSRRLWIRLGAVLGLGLLNKIDVLWLGLGLLLALLFTEQKKWLKTRWPYIAAGIAFALFLPHIIWQIQNGWPTLEFMQNARIVKYHDVSRFDFIVGQFLIQHPFAAPIWIAGLASLLFYRLRGYRAVGIIWLTAFLILLVSGRSKPEYLGPAFPMILAAGGVAIEIYSRQKTWMWFRPAAIGALVINGMISAPFTIPLLPVDSFIRYSQALGMRIESAEKKDLHELPQHYADQFGHENMVATLARAYDRLDLRDRLHCVIFASHYGFAGAIDFYREKYDLPPARASHNNYWLWGPGEKPGNVVLSVGLPGTTMLKYFASVAVMDTVRSKYAMPYETNVPVLLCREPYRKLPEIWPALKRFE